MVERPDRFAVFAGPSLLLRLTSARRNHRTKAVETASLGCVLRHSRYK